MKKILVLFACSTIAFTQSQPEPASTNKSDAPKANQGARDLPPEARYSYTVSFRYDYDPNLQSHAGTVQVPIDPPYHACRVQSEDYNFTGNVVFGRAKAATDRMIEYSYQIAPDKIFKLPSSLYAHLVIVGVLDREKSKCEPYDKAFPFSMTRRTYRRTFSGRFQPICLHLTGSFFR